MAAGLPAELTLEVCNKGRSAKMLLMLSQVNSKWRKAASADEPWRAACREMWRTKQYVPAKFYRMLSEEGGARRAYFESVSDSKRVHITREELCSFRWHYRFKARAGKHWLQEDPFWMKQPCRKVNFQKDGTVTWEGGWEGWDGIHWRFVKPPQKHGVGVDGAMLCEPGWKTESAIRQYHPEYGWFPSNTVVRHPTSWGFILNAPWEIYSTVPMSRDSIDKWTSDRKLNSSVTAWQHDEAEEYNARNEYG